METSLQNFVGVGNTSVFRVSLIYSEKQLKDIEILLTI